MIRRSLAAAAAALTLLAQPTSVAAQPFENFGVMVDFKTELDNHTLTQAQYDTLNATYTEGLFRIGDSIVRLADRSTPPSDPQAAKHLDAALDDLQAAVKRKDATGAVDAAEAIGRAVQGSSAKSLISAVSIAADEIYALEDQLITQRKNMGNFDPVATNNMSHQNDLARQRVGAYFNGLGTYLHIDAPAMTPAQRDAAIKVLQTKFDNGTLGDGDPPVPPLTGAGWPSDNQPPPADPTTDATPTDPTTAPADPTTPPGRVDTHHGSGAGTSQDPSTDPFYHVPLPPPVAPQPPATPPVVTQQQPRTPPPFTPDPTPVLVLTHPDGMAGAGSYIYSTDSHGNRVLVEFDDPMGGKTYYGTDGKTPLVYVDADGQSHVLNQNNLMENGGGNGSGGGGGGSNGGGSGIAPATKSNVSAQKSPLNANGGSFQGYENGQAYTVAQVKPIYNGWTYGPNNAGSIYQTPDLYPPGPSSVMNTPHPDVFGPSSVMNSLGNELTGLSINSGLRVGTPVGDDWSMPGAIYSVPGFDSLCGR